MNKIDETNLIVVDAKMMIAWNDVNYYRLVY